MSQITRAPRGLQEYLGTQNQGQNPVDLSPQVSPVLSMEKFYEIEKRRVQSTAFSPTAIDTDFTVATVPSGEVWYIEQVGFQTVFSGASSGDFTRPSVYLKELPNNNLTGQNVPVATFGQVSFLAAATQRVAQSLPTPVMVWGGSRILGGLLDVSLTAGSVSGTVYITYLKLKY